MKIMIKEFIILDHEVIFVTDPKMMEGILQSMFFYRISPFITPLRICWYCEGTVQPSHSSCPYCTGNLANAYYLLGMFTHVLVFVTPALFKEATDGSLCR